MGAGNPEQQATSAARPLGLKLAPGALGGYHWGLPVKRAMLAYESARADAAALIEGQAATQRLLAKALERAAIVELNPQGEPFDANLHEAMAAQPSATAEPNSVLAVVQRGYSLNGRLLRAARVVIARAPE